MPAISVFGAFQAGEQLYLRAPTRAIELGVGPEGRLVIGNEVLINDGASIRSELSISIGSYCLIAENVAITDTHWHQIDEGDRTRRSPVVIEDNVWIGRGCIILPGVQIGRNSVIGAGSVVTKSIPPNVVALGSPARIVRSLRASENFVRL